MNSGVLVMDKPQGFTSFDVIGKLRGIMKMKKLGHTGTLDPMATGVLPVLVGTAARACDILPDERKAYRAGFQLGTVTDTQDSTGNVLETHDFSVDEAAILRVLPQFTGTIEQIPPMFSAVQINGKRLYELAREGKVIERPARTVNVEQLTLEAFDPETGCGTLYIECGKGTYVRTVLHDIGQTLGCGCIMTALRRTMACGFTLVQAHTFDEVQNTAGSGTLDALIIPTDTLFLTLPDITLNEMQTKLYRNGVQLALSRIRSFPDAVRVRVYTSEHEFLGLADADREHNCLRIFKNL
jgi:tRNA pseudouridine55 synthase